MHRDVSPGPPHQKEFSKTGLSILMSVIHANDIPRETAAEASNRKSIQQFHVNCGWLFPNVIQRGRGCAVVKGCFLIAQLEMAFVKSKFYLFKMAPWLSPEMHGMLRIKTKNAINSPSRRSGEITDKVLSIIHTVPNLARINVCRRRSSLSFVCWRSCWAKLALHVAHYNQTLFGKAPVRTGSDHSILQGNLYLMQFRTDVISSIFFY